MNKSIIRADPPVSPARTIPGHPLTVSLKCLAYEDPELAPVSTGHSA